MRKKIGFISLGCPKNQVDSELMLEKLSSAGYEIINTPIGADVVIINTCGFIDAAKSEAIDNILEMAQHKENGDVGKIIVIGCLAQRYKDQILEELPEVDAVAGLGINGDIVGFVESVLAGEKQSEYPEKTLFPLEGARLLTTPEHWAYLKISDGCSNCCSYCAIPMIRGRFRSRTIESCVEEAKLLAQNGVKELIVVAQDTTRFGLDNYGELKLPELLRELDKIDGLRWIRLLYCYPERITDELLQCMRDSKKILHYIDLPLQHVDSEVLKAMNRSGGREEMTALIKKIRSYLPDCILRTTLIAGFPGETDAAHCSLVDFIKEIQFDRLGCFEYSREEGTPAAAMENQVDSDIAVNRGKEIMTIQQDIFIRKQKDFLGTVQSCMIEGYDSYTDVYYGRTWMDAPEIDVEISILSDHELTIGDVTDVKIVGMNESDLVGEAI